MQIKLISLDSNINIDVFEPTGVDMHAHEVAMHDSLLQTMCHGRYREKEEVQYVDQVGLRQLSIIDRHHEMVW